MSGEASAWASKLNEFLNGEIARKSGLSEDSFGLDFRLIGMNSALGGLERRTGAPCEVGVLCLVTAPSQDAANEIAN